MAHFVHVDCTPPSDAVPLDPLQRAGVAALFGRALEQVDTVPGPAGEAIAVASGHVASHPAGARLLLALDTPALAAAEHAAHAAVEEILLSTEEFIGWRVTAAEVRLHAELMLNSLAAADGPDAPPSDPAERARQLRGSSVGHVSDELDENDDAVTDEAALRAMAGRLSYGLDAFGCSRTDDTDTREAAELAAGAAVYAMSVLTDELFADLVTLTAGDCSAEDAGGGLLALDLLPTAFAGQYRPPFVRRFILATASTVQRLTSSPPGRLGSTAEELAFRLLLSEAVGVLETYDLHDDATEDALEAFKDAVLEDGNHERLYDLGADHKAVDVMAWFAPFRPDAAVHPYILDRSN